MAKKTETVATATTTVFRALVSPKQCFAFGGVTYHFHDGVFTTTDAEVIAFLQANPHCEQVQ